MLFYSNTKNIMNTIAFNILLCLYCLLFILCVALWVQVRKSEAYIRANNKKRGKHVTTIVVIISFLIALAVWFLLPEIRYRTIAAIVIYIPIVLFVYKTRSLSLRFKTLGVLISCIYIPMIILYLR